MVPMSLLFHFYWTILFKEYSRSFRKTATFKGFTSALQNQNLIQGVAQPCVMYRCYLEKPSVPRLVRHTDVSSGVLNLTLAESLMNVYFFLSVNRNSTRLHMTEGINPR